MRFYSMSFPDAMALPIGVFWELTLNISRIRAEESRHLLMVFANGMAGKPAEYMADLERMRGQVAEFEGGSADTPRFDKAGFERLKALMTRGK